LKFNRSAQSTVDIKTQRSPQQTQLVLVGKAKTPVNPSSNKGTAVELTQAKQSSAFTRYANVVSALPNHGTLQMEPELVLRARIVSCAKSHNDEANELEGELY
jgi:hypothetical protein